jgi:predicted DCC family thiol-disulfide oxidoreductase YuxK
MSGGEAVAWVNIAGGTDEQLAPGLTRDSAARRLHARLPDGRIVSGARAFSQVWLSLTRLKWLGRLANLPLMEPILERTYQLFLRVRPQLQRLAVRWEALSKADRQSP